METPARIPLDEADFATLKHFAETQLGLEEIKDGTNLKTIRAKIRSAMPNCESIPPLPAPPAPIEPDEAFQHAPVQAQFTPYSGEEPEPLQFNNVGEAPAQRPAAVSRRPSRQLMHPSQDPKVTLRFHKTDDKRRAREVTFSVNGYVCRYRRGVDVEVPYRIYRAACNATEMAAVETDDINPFTGEPVMGWEDIQSYPFSIVKLPPEEEIRAWNAATSGGFADRAPVARAA